MPSYRYVIKGFRSALRKTVAVIAAAVLVLSAAFPASCLQSFFSDTAYASEASSELSLAANAGSSPSSSSSSASDSSGSTGSSDSSSSDSDSGDTGSADSDSGDTGSGEDLDSNNSPSAYIDDISIFITEDGSSKPIYLAYASNEEWGGTKSDPKYTVSSRGQFLELQAQVFWNGTAENGSRYVSWSTGDTSVATISNGGKLSPAGNNGTVKVTCTVDGSHTKDGKDLAASFWVKFIGQTDARYVTKIRIIDSEGTVASTAPYIIEDENITEAYMQFYALVDVYDPVTEKTTTYDTRDGLLNTQASDIPNLEWTVAFSELGVIDASSGTYRPIISGLETIYATSTAGIDGTIRGEASIRTIDPNASTEEDYHPQSSIRILAYYENYPPKDISDPDDSRFVLDKTFSLEDLSALGTFKQRYTALTGDGYATISAEGVSVKEVLEASGVNMEGINKFYFKTADQDVYSRAVSYDSLFKTRYFYPNIATNGARYAGSQRVEPMFAFKSIWVANAGTESRYDDMSEATRFRLVFGALPTESNSSLQVKWINTVYIELEGGPSTEAGDGNGDGDGDDGGTGGVTDPDDPSPEDPDDPTPGTGDDGTGGGGTGTGDNSGGDGSGTGAGDNTGSSTGTGDSGTQGGTDVKAYTDAGTGEGDTGEGSASPNLYSEHPASVGASKNDAGEEGGLKSANESSEGSEVVEIDADDISSLASSGSYSILQAMNPNDSLTEDIDYNNPLRGFAGPIGGLVLIAGGLQAFVWFRRQSVPTFVAAVAKASGV